MKQAVAFVVTLADGTKELHVFTENGTLKLPANMVSIVQVQHPVSVYDAGGGSCFVGMPGATGAAR